MAGEWHPNAICVWCQRPLTDAAGRALPGKRFVVASWRHQEGPPTPREGYACNEAHRDHWEPGWGRSYKGTDYGERQEAIWRSRSWPKEK